MKEKHNLEEPIGFNPNMPMNEKIPTLGRIFCDSEGRLNANSVLLQGSQDLSRGRALPLDLSQVNDFTEILRKNGESKFPTNFFHFQLKEYSVFPGQVVHSTVTNPSGTRLISHGLTCDATPNLAPLTTKLREDDVIQVVVASGPFATNDSLAYEPFKVNIFKVILQHKLQY